MFLGPRTVSAAIQLYPQEVSNRIYLRGKRLGKKPRHTIIPSMTILPFTTEVPKRPAAQFSILPAARLGRPSGFAVGFRTVPAGRSAPGLKGWHRFALPPPKKAAMARKISDTVSAINATVSVNQAHRSSQRRARAPCGPQLPRSPFQLGSAEDGNRRVRPPQSPWSPWQSWS
jgi:hypothetical protein